MEMDIKKIKEAFKKGIISAYDLIPEQQEELKKELENDLNKKRNELSNLKQTVKDIKNKINK